MGFLPHPALGQPVDQWSHRFDIADWSDAAFDVVPLAGAGSLVVGQAPDSSGNTRAWAASLDDQGNVNWSKHYDVGDPSQFLSVIALTSGTHAGDFVAIGSATISGIRAL